MQYCNRFVVLALVLGGIFTRTGLAQENNPTSKPSTGAITQKDGIYLYR